MFCIAFFEAADSLYSFIQIKGLRLTGNRYSQTRKTGLIPGGTIFNQLFLFSLLNINTAL